MTLSNPFTHDPRVYNEAQSLIDAGHKVTVFAWDRKNKNKKKELFDDIKIIRSSNTSFMNLIPYDIFRLFFWWKKAVKEIELIHDENHFDVIHCHNLDTLPIGVSLKKKFGLPLVYDAHEIWGYMVSRDLPKVWANYYLFKEKRLMKYVDKIVTVNKPLKNYFSKISHKPITLVMNAKPLMGKKYIPSNNEMFTLLFIGNLSKSRFLHELVDVVSEFSDIRCIIGGMGSKKDYVEKLKDKCKKANNVQFIGKVPIHEVLPMTQKADVIVCMTNPTDSNNSIATANKQFEAMVSGRPIICTKDTYPGEFTEKYNVGLTCKYEKNDLKNAIIKLKEYTNLREQLGRNALNKAVEEFNWKKQEKKLVDLYENLC